MALATLHPTILSPAYNPLIINLFTTLSAQTGMYFKIAVSASTSTALTDLGSYKKTPVYGANNFFDISRTVQTQLGYSFPPSSFTKVHGDGNDNLRHVSIGVYETTGYSTTVYTIAFNGYIDRNERINWTYDDVLPLGDNSSYSFLTNQTNRLVYSDDYGTLSTFNGYIGTIPVNKTCNNKYININTYNKTNSSQLKQSYHIHNHLWNSSTGATIMENKRITIPTGPKNLNESIPLEFYDNDFGLSGLSGGTVGFRFTTPIPSNITTGDTIQISQYAGYTNSSYNGLANVIWVSSDRLAIDTTKGWGVSTPAEGGVIYAINRHSVFSANTTPITVSATTSTSGSLTLNFATPFDATTIPYGTTLYLNGFTSASYNTTVIAGSGITNNTLVVPEVAYISNQSGSMIMPSRFVVGDVVDSNTGKYTLQMASSPQYTTGATSAYTAVTLTTYGQDYVYNVDHTCGKYEDLHVAYQNVLGAMDYINLRMRRTKVRQFQKESYRKALPANWYGINGWFGNDTTTQYQHELQNFNGSQQDSWILNSGYLDEDGAKRILELAGSNKVYAYINEWKPVVVTVEELVEQTRKDNGLIQYQITVDLSYKQFTQRY